MGSVALITLMYRICSKPATGNSGRYGRRSPTANGRCARGHQSHADAAAAGGLPPTAFQRLSQRLSLTSMQARVMSRLRDQPPKYESQHHYDTRMQLDQRSPPTSDDAVVTVAVDPASTSDGVRTVAVRMTDDRVVGTAPPCYDNDAYSVSEKMRP